MSTYIYIYVYIWEKNYETPVFCFQFSDVSWLWRWRIWRLKSFGYLWILIDQSPSEDVKQWEKQKDQVNACLESGLLGWAAAIRWVFWRPIKIISTHSKRPMNMWVFSWLASTRWKTIGWKPPKWRFRKLRSFSKRWFLHNTGFDMSWFLLSWKWLHQNSQKWLHPPSGFYRSKNRPF